MMSIDISENYMLIFQYIKDNIRVVKKAKKEYYNIALGFDIETTQIPYHKINGDVMIDEEYMTKELARFANSPVSFMWHWQMAFFAGEDEYYITGRRWEEWQIFMQGLKEYLGLGSKRILVIYVHNLAYEFQYIQDFFGWDSVFARQPRRVMKALTREGFEFRCSYFLSNMSLKKWLENTEGVIHQKMDGDLDYSKYRDWTTPISSEEYRYCINDVLGLVEALWQQMEGEGDTIVSIPLTSTGYVRREVRSYIFEHTDRYKYRKMIKESFPSADVYSHLKKVFRGGDTHAYFALANKCLTNIHSFDIKSSYIAWIEYEEYPIGRGQEYLISSLDELIQVMDDKLLILEIDLFDLEVNFDTAMPYIDFAHVSSYRNIHRDNGRILEAEYVHYHCTSVDLEIILKEYSFSEIGITYCYGWRKEKLPKPLLEIVYEYFKRKTELDGLEDYYYEYVKRKNKVNSIFGMMVTAYDMWDVIYNEDTNLWSTEVGELEGLLDKVKNSYNTFLLYQWGVFITAYARYHLHMMLQKVKLDSVYIDTDSLKFMNDDNKRFFLEENDRIKKIAEENLAIAYNPLGEAEILGVWKDEGKYDEFKTVGAKKYCYKKNEKYEVTVSGMNKEKGSEKIKSMDDFELGKVYEDVGRHTSWYNDNIPFYTRIKGVDILITPNVGILETTYTLGVTDEYMELLLLALEDLEEKKS